MRESPCPTMPDWPRTVDWIAQRQRVERNTVAPTLAKTKQNNGMIPNDTLLYT